MKDEYLRFLSHVDKSGGSNACHEWQLARTKAGYGKFKCGGRTFVAHRWLLGHLRGEHLKKDELACHHCDNPPCCNPSHLYIGTHLQNMRDRAERGRGRFIVAEMRKQQTHCIKGHPFDEKNTYFRREGRACRECNRIAVCAYRSRKRVFA